MSIVDDPIGDLKLVETTALQDDIRGPDGKRLIFTEQELERFDTKLLRRLAAYAETSEVHGKSTMLEIVHYFNCQRSLAEYN